MAGRSSRGAGWDGGKKKVPGKFLELVLGRPWALGEGTVVGESGVMAREGGAAARFCGMEKGRHQKDYSS